MAGQRCSSSEFQGFSVAVALVSVPAQRQRRSSSVFQRLSVPAAAAAVRGRAALQQFRVSGLQRSRCGGRGACLGSVAAVQSFRASAFPLRRRRCVPGQRQRRSSSVFQRLSVPAAAAAVRGWAASASQQFSVSGFERCRCPGVSACPALASQQFRVPEFQRLSVPAAAAAGRGWAALQQFSVSEFKRLSVAAAAAAGRGWAALQQFRVSGLQRSRCGGRGACLGSVSVAAVQCFSG